MRGHKEQKEALDGIRLGSIKECAISGDIKF